jgi:hypothetical protein
MGIIIVIIRVNYGDMAAVWLVKLHNVVVGRDKSKVKITCHHLESKMKNYQLRCALAIVSSLDGIAGQD